MRLLKLNRIQAVRVDRFKRILLSCKQSVLFIFSCHSLKFVRMRAVRLFDRRKLDHAIDKEVQGD